MWKFTLLAVMVVLVATTAYAVDKTGQDAPPLDAYEIISAGGAYGDMIDIDDFLGQVLLINFWSDS